MQKHGFRESETFTKKTTHITEYLPKGLRAALERLPWSAETGQPTLPVNSMSGCAAYGKSLEEITK